MQYAWKRGTTAHILDDDGRSLCQAEKTGWKPIGSSSFDDLPGGIKKICGNCDRLMLEIDDDEDEGPTADEVKTAEAAQIIKLEAKISVLEKDVERLLAQINPNEELERMEAIRDQLSAAE